MGDKVHTFVVLAYKESPYLENCIQSVLNQKYKSEVVIATSTPNDFIDSLAKKYKLKVMVNKEHRSIGGDFDFAISVAKTSLVTVAHQDDIYDHLYSQNIVCFYNKYPNALILFPYYYEIKGENKIYRNTNLIIKKILLFPLKIKILGKFRFLKRFVLRFGNPIGCPAVTFNTKKISLPLFEYDFKCNIDWHAWETLSQKKGFFILISEPLMGHRVHDKSTTTELIQNRTRTKEDLVMFQRFWPTFIAKWINHFYVKAEKNNE